MLAQTYLASYAYENDLVLRLRRELVPQNHSTHIYAKIVEDINRDIAQQRYTRNLVVRIRLAIKLNPYTPDIPHLIDTHNKILRHIMAPHMGPLLETIAKCEKLGLPVPIIVSCTKYLSKAQNLRQAFPARYFGIDPIIVRGDVNTQTEIFENGVLTLCVNDSYEALPTKILEIATFLNAFTTTSGFMKIDDDLTLVPFGDVNYQTVHDTLKAADYLGTSKHHSFQDRVWHAGKCAQDIPVIYCKPFIVNWPRGPFYTMSKLALQQLSQHYIRFPGLLDGEIYEDKAVAEILYQYQIIVVPYVLEHLFGFATENPERLVNQ